MTRVIALLVLLSACIEPDSPYPPPRGDYSLAWECQSNCIVDVPFRYIHELEVADEIVWDTGEHGLIYGEYSVDESCIFTAITTEEWRTDEIALCSEMEGFAGVVTYTPEYGPQLIVEWLLVGEGPR